MIKMHDMILYREGRRHNVTDIVGVLGDSYAQSILDGADGGEGVRRGANAANALDICPCVARIAIFHYKFQAAPCRAA